MSRINNLAEDGMEARTGIEPVNKGFADLHPSGATPADATAPARSGDFEPNLIQRYLPKYRAVCLCARHEPQPDGTDKAIPDEQAFFADLGAARAWAAKMHAKTKARTVIFQITEQPIE